ncbi:MAG: dipeptidase PepV [Bacilli bacterium]
MSFKKDVYEIKKNIIKDLQEWVKLGSVYDSKTITDKKPFGEGVARALEYIAILAKKDGFKVDTCDGYVTEITYDLQKDSTIMVLGHADVVPVGNGWSYPPFGAVIDNNVIYGRGSSDDKGPTMAAYYALKLIKQLNIPLNSNIKIVVGGNEENGSACLDYYFNELKRPHPTYGFTPDAEFPLIYGEKGILNYVYSGKYEDEVIESLNGGVAANSVPDTALAIFKKVINLEKEFNDFLEKENLEGNYKNDDNGKTTIQIKGKAAHGSMPMLGINALTKLLEFISLYTNSSLANHFARFFSDYYGKNLKINYSGPAMGELTMNLGIGEYSNNEYKFILNIRYPIEVDFSKMVKKLDEAIFHLGKCLGDSKPLYIDPQSKLIRTLLEVYQRVSGDYETKPMTIGGGTYARNTINTVAYGMDFLTHKGNGTGNIHTINEGLNIDDLLLGVEIYLEALIALGNLKNETA